jgi:hypothetical protein
MLRPSAQRRAAPDTRGEGARDESVGITAHPQRGHEVFEHGAGPGEQDESPKARACSRPSLNQLSWRNLVAGNGKERGNAGFGGDHVVTGFVELLRAHVVADGKNLAAGVGEKGEFRFFETLGLLCDGAKSSGKVRRFLRGCRQRRAEMFVELSRTANCYRSS